MRGKIRGWAFFTILGASPFSPALARPPATEGRQGPSVRDFFIQSYTKNQKRIETRFDADYLQAVAQGIADTPANKDRFMKLMFLRAMVMRGGMLHNRYIDRKADGRHPDTLVLDAFSADPPYRQVVSGKPGGREEPIIQRVAKGGDIQSFARCDEFEMEFRALAVRIFDFPSASIRIVMVGSNHVNTEVYFDGGYLLFDNSIFLTITYAKRPTPDMLPKDTEDGQYDIRRPNRFALRDFHPDRRLDPRGADRVSAALEAFLSVPRPSGASPFAFELLLPIQ